MKIKHVLLSESYTGFYFDDQVAIKKGATQDGFFYVGEPLTPGFQAIRQKGEAISVQIVLEDNTVGIGDCAAVQYSGTGGRDPLFLASDFIPFMEEHLVPLLENETFDGFRRLAEKYDTLKVNGKPLHNAIRYGLTQAFLNTAAAFYKLTPAEVIRKEYKIPSTTYKHIPVFTQSGDDRYNNVDKMILKEADVLPHALINNVEKKLGLQGEKLFEYVGWLRDRILLKRVKPTYNPVFHIDVYGTIGIAFHNDYDAMTSYLLSLEQQAKPFLIRIEGPVDTGDREGTMLALKELTKRMNQASSTLEIVADEWCNTLEDIKYFADQQAGHMLQIKTPDLGGINNVVEAIIYCNQLNVGSYCGGTCNETNVSSEATTNIAIACHAKQCLAKPGMAVDEGYMIVKNVMNRVVKLANHR
jgi:methylaspartate ammonia-lyase